MATVETDVIHAKIPEKNILKGLQFKINQTPLPYISPTERNLKKLNVAPLIRGNEEICGLYIHTAIPRKKTGITKDVLKSNSI